MNQTSKSQNSSPFFFVKKKTADLRPVQDYRNLNKITKKNCYHYHLLVNIGQNQGCEMVYQDGCKKGYNNIQMKKEKNGRQHLRQRGLFEHWLCSLDSVIHQEHSKPLWIISSPT